MSQNFTLVYDASPGIQMERFTVEEGETIVAALRRLGLDHSPGFLFVGHPAIVGEGEKTYEDQPAGVEGEGEEEGVRAMRTKEGDSTT